MRWKKILHEEKASNIEADNFLCSRVTIVWRSLSLCPFRRAAPGWLYQFVSALSRQRLVYKCWRLLKFSETRLCATRLLTRTVTLTLSSAVAAGHSEAVHLAGPTLAVTVKKPRNWRGPSHTAVPLHELQYRVGSPYPNNGATMQRVWAYAETVRMQQQNLKLFLLLFLKLATFAPTRLRRHASWRAEGHCELDAGLYRVSVLSCLWSRQPLRDVTAGMVLYAIKLPCSQIR